MLNSDTRAWLEIDLSKIAHNVEEVRKLIPSQSKIMAIVKANGYGHGDVVCAKELVKCGIDFFGVSSIDEAVTLRENGIEEEILILGYTPPIHFPLLVKYDILQTFVGLEYAKKANIYAKEHGVTLRGHVKVDTGMSRIGIICQEHEYHIEEVKQVYQMQHLDVCGIFSHFSVSDYLDEENKVFTANQMKLFERVLEDLRQAGIEPGTKHLQNSYGILNYPDLTYDYVRPGLLWMGVTSDDQVKINTAPNFQPIMQWKANVSLVKEIQPGVSVSYGRHFKADTLRKVATVALGYADGFPRCVSNQGARVLLHGQYANIIGNVCMDQMMIDVTEIDNVKEGDIVTIVGEDQGQVITVDELSRLSNTINNETLCWISARVPRIYK